MAQVTVRSDSGLRTAIEVRGHTLFADEPPENDGLDTAPTPTEILLGALGACMVITAQLYARRKQWPLEGVSIKLNMMRVKAADYPAYVGSAAYINQVHHQMTFQGTLSDEQIARLTEIGGRCPIHRTLEYPTFFVNGFPELAEPQ